MVNHGLWSKQTNMEQHGQPCFWFKQTMDYNMVNHGLGS